jgi:hypothetical protein
MNAKHMILGFLALLLGVALLSPATIRAHCDTLDGPVIAAAKLALDQKNVTPVLKWIKKDQEAEIQEVFSKSLAVRAKGPEARELADRFFFETLVRIHRQGEGAPYTGLKLAGTGIDPEIKRADEALNAGSVDELTKLLTNELHAGLRERFAKVQAAKAHAEHSVAAGREYVAAYVDYVHYVEALHQALQGTGSHHEVEAAKETPHSHNLR